MQDANYSFLGTQGNANNSWITVMSLANYLTAPTTSAARFRTMVTVSGSTAKNVNEQLYSFVAIFR
jgi:hypothetical protein